MSLRRSKLWRGDGKVVGTDVASGGGAVCARSRGGVERSGHPALKDARGWLDEKLLNFTGASTTEIGLFFYRKINVQTQIF